MEEIKQEENKQEQLQEETKPEQLQEKGPFTFSLTYFAGLFFLMTWICLFPSVIVGYFYFYFFPFSFKFLQLLLLIPLFFLLYGIALLTSLFAAKIGIWIVHKRITYPELGTYRYSMDEPQTRAFILKGNIRNFGRWLYYFFHIPFLGIFWRRRMGVKIGKNVKLGQYTEDDEFIEIGENTFMARETVLTGHMIDHETITLTHTIIGKNCILNFATGGSGANVGDNSILEPITAIFKGQIFRGNAIYKGIPAKKVGVYSDLSPETIAEMKQAIRKIDKKDFIKDKNAPIVINTIKLFFLKMLVIIGACSFAFLFLYLYYLFFKSFYIPGSHLFNILLLTLVPIFFMIVMGAFVVGSAIVIKILLIYYNRKADIPEGTYEVNDPRMKIFKIKYLLRLFGLRIFRGTPFKIADTFLLRFWGGIVIGKYVKLDVAIIDPQYLEIGDYSQLTARTRVHTHDISNGEVYIKKVKIGKNVLIGGFSHIKPGVEIADNSFGGIAAWFRKNQKCKRRALYLGKPVAEFPIELVNKAVRAKERYID